MKKHLAVVLTLALACLGAVTQTSAAVGPDSVAAVIVSVTYGVGEQQVEASRSFNVASASANARTLTLEATSDVPYTASSSIAEREGKAVVTTQSKLATEGVTVELKEAVLDPSHLTVYGKVSYSKLQSLEKFALPDGQTIALPNTESGAVPVRMIVGKVGQVSEQKVDFVTLNGDRIPVTLSVTRTK